MKYTTLVAMTLACGLHMMGDTAYAQSPKLTPRDRRKDDWFTSGRMTNTNATASMILARMRQMKASAPTRQRLAELGAGNAVVEKTRVIVLVAAPVWRLPKADSAKSGFYEWRLDMMARNEMSENVSIVIASDTAMRTNNIDDILKGSKLMRCTDPDDITTESCTVPLVGSVYARGVHVRIDIRDTALVALVRRTRPLSVTAATFEPMGKFRTDNLKFTYVDKLLGR